jgi:hypothetical protein
MPYEEVRLTVRAIAPHFLSDASSREQGIERNAGFSLSI